MTSTIPMKTSAPAMPWMVSGLFVSFMIVSVFFKRPSFRRRSQGWNQVRRIGAGTSPDALSARILLDVVRFLLAILGARMVMFVNEIWGSRRGLNPHHLIDSHGDSHPAEPVWWPTGNVSGIHVSATGAMFCRVLAVSYRTRHLKEQSWG